MKLAPEWVRTSDPVIRSPARYRWTTASAHNLISEGFVYPSKNIIIVVIKFQYDDYKIKCMWGLHPWIMCNIDLDWLAFYVIYLDTVIKHPYMPLFTLSNNAWFCYLVYLWHYTDRRYCQMCFHSFYLGYMAFKYVNLKHILCHNINW